MKRTSKRTVELVISTLKKRISVFPTGGDFEVTSKRTHDTRDTNLKKTISVLRHVNTHVQTGISAIPAWVEAVKWGVGMGDRGALPARM
jgi:hypothetical protein